MRERERGRCAGAATGAKSEVRTRGITDERTGATLFASCFGRKRKISGNVNEMLPRSLSLSLAVSLTLRGLVSFQGRALKKRQTDRERERERERGYRKGRKQVYGRRYSRTASIQCDCEQKSGTEDSAQSDRSVARHTKGAHSLAAPNVFKLSVTNRPARVNCVSVCERVRVLRCAMTGLPSPSSSSSSSSSGSGDGSDARSCRSRKTDGNGEK